MEDSEDQLRAEIARLQGELNGHKHAQSGVPRGENKQPSRSTLVIIGAVAVIIMIVAFFGGYLPLIGKQTALAKEAKEESAAIPVVNVTPAQRAAGKSELVLPGNLQAETEAPVVGHQAGYIVKRYADIGDQVKEGQVLAEIRAVELDEQVRQAAATREQAGATLEQANASLKQGRTNYDMANVTAERYKGLLEQGAVNRQDTEVFRAQADALRASVNALENAASAAKASLAASEDNLARLTQVQGYLKVKAPFSGVITQRNVDTGTLVADGSTLLFRIAQIGTLRAFVNVPQSDAVAIRVGQTAEISIPNMPSTKFTGTVRRTASALDPVTRTMLTEVELNNSKGLLLPGMYAQVNFATTRAEPPMVVKGDTLVIRADGPQVAIVGSDDLVHFKHVALGRDFGDRVEVLSGITEGDRLIINPGDSVREGVKIRPVLLAKPGR